MNFNELNLDCLKEIDYQATNNKRNLEFRESVTHLTDDMLDIIDYLEEKSIKMSFNYPSFSAKYEKWFSYDGVLYRLLTLQSGLYITTDLFIGDEDEDEDYTFKEFLEDYDAYYYLDLDTMTVKSLWDNKEYIVKEKV